MRAVVQRVKNASVQVGENQAGAVENGLLVFLGVTHNDTENDAKYLADKIAGLRIFEDSDDKLNLSVQDVGGSVLSVSQFTLFGDCRRGRRPSFTEAAPAAQGDALYEAFNRYLRENGLQVETGQFQTHMEVSLVNDGPVTILLDSQKQF